MLIETVFVSFKRQIVATKIGDTPILHTFAGEPSGWLNTVKPHATIVGPTKSLFYPSLSPAEIYTAKLPAAEMRETRKQRKSDWFFNRKVFRADNGIEVDINQADKNTVLGNSSPCADLTKWPTVKWLTPVVYQNHDDFIVFEAGETCKITQLG